jgi:hypothetical protein
MDKFEEQLNKRLAGRTIKKVKWLSAEDSQEFFGWDYQPCEIHLDDGTILTPSADDEGNNAGAIFTNIKGLETIPVDREPVLSKKMKRVYEDVKKQIEREVNNG